MKHHKEVELTIQAIIGYARTSTTDQKAGLDAQLHQLRLAGCNKIFQEEVSSTVKARPQLEIALDYVRQGDIFLVTRLDRLARSVADLVNITERLKAKDVGLRILSMNLDTETPTGKLMMNLLGSIAEFERELMLERQKDGIARAKAAGKYKGRKPTARMKAPEIIRLKQSGIKAEEIARTVGVSRASVFRVLNG